jgi:hypothetical protein
MKRLALVIAIALLVGCAHDRGRQEIVNGMNLEQQMEAYIDDYVEQVLDLCVEMHGMAGSGESPVDCAFSADLSAMHLSFPSIAYHNEHYQQIAEMEYHWCAAAQAKSGNSVRWVRHFRREQKLLSRPCYKGENLKQLLKASNDAPMTEPPEYDEAPPAIQRPCPGWENHNPPKYPNKDGRCPPPHPDMPKGPKDRG